MINPQLDNRKTICGVERRTIVWIGVFSAVLAIPYSALLASSCVWVVSFVWLCLMSRLFCVDASDVYAAMLERGPFSKRFSVLKAIAAERVRQRNKARLIR